MNVEDFERSLQKEELIHQIESCDWSAAKFLANILRKDTFRKTLGGWAKLFVLTDGGKLVSFVTLSCQDCIDDVSLTPWFGFLYTQEQYRGNGYAKQLLDYACIAAQKMGYNKVFLATDHVGLYEKYGFSYLESRIDVYNETSRIYVKELC